jgi:anti-sigma factor RsiW
MTCRELVDFLGEYFDGELSDEVRRHFDAHLTACAECSTYLASYRETVRLAKDAMQASDDPVPASVPESLVQAILAARRKG